jgi:DNA-binding NarL/FixJ family response regulator
VTLRVVVADRSAFVRVAVRGALEAEGIEVVAEADEAADALHAILAHRPDAVLFDAEFDDGMAVLAAVRRELPETVLIMLSPDESEARAMAAVSAGACGFLPKDTSPDRLPDIVRGAVAGEAAIPRRVVRRLLERIGAPHAIHLVAASPGPAEPLTAREREVLERVARGMTDRQIAAELGVSDVTVRRHAASAARKLHAVRREDAIAAFRRLVA